MKFHTYCLVLASAVAWADAPAQGSDDALQMIRACTVLPRAERLECFDKLTRDVVPPSPDPAASPAPTVKPSTDIWTISETTSPIDYTPVAVASASYSGGTDGTAMQFSIQCRASRAELVISSPALTRRAEEYALSYSVDGGPRVTAAVGTAGSGVGIAIKGDVARLLVSLPDRGDLIFRVTDRQASTLEGRYSLSSLKLVLDRLAVPCGWSAGSAPRG